MQNVGFFVAFSFCSSFAQAAGHELVHRKETLNKVLGSIPYYTAFYSHFAGEHTQGHHKHVASPLDANFVPRGDSIYWSILKSWYKTHIYTWNREASRITKFYLDTTGQEAPLFARILYNVMTAYFFLHACLALAIYKVFGMGGLYFQLWHVVSSITWIEQTNYL